MNSTDTRNLDGTLREHIKQQHPEIHPVPRSNADLARTHNQVHTHLGDLMSHQHEGQANA